MENLYKINKTLFENIINKGFTSFTDVQKTVIDKKNYNRDLLVSSKTGSGKTLAYGLSISDHILNTKIKVNSTPTGLIVAPTRELALQVFEEIIWLYKKTKLIAVTSIGGMDINKERKKISKKFNLLNWHARKNK